MRCLQSLLLLILTACMLFVCKVKAIVCAGNDDRSLDLSKLYWSDGSYGGENDVVTVKLCGDTSHDYEIKLKNGTVIGKTYNRTSPTSHGETMLTFTANGGYKTFLYFACEKNTLGVPILLDSYNKTYFLEWRSLIACKDVPTVDLMPCYVYTSTQQLIDLSPLTKTTGYYEIPTTGGRQLRVNVCGHIGDPNCRNNSVCSAAGADFKNVSKMEKSTKLAFINKTVQLRYSKASGDDGCDTLINFICPANPQQASGPEVKSSCSDDKTQPWVIDWHTTHACVSSHLSSNNCTLNNPQYGVDVDLSPLRNDGRPFSVVEGDYTYRIGLCGTTVTDCPLKPSDNGTRGYTVACQSKGGGKTSIGKSKFTQLKYFDDVLVMRLFKGTPCGNHVQRETIIHFHCNKTAGVGHPTYQSETHCSYHFDWNTTYACPSCKYVDTNNTFDFSRLTSAADSSSWTTSTANNAIAYVNVCAGLSGVSGCDSNAGICVKTPGKSHGTSWGDARTMAFGKVGHTIILSYTNGDVCDEHTGERHETSIYFGCSNTESRGPQWRNEPSSTCKHSFIWFTSAACSHNSSASPDCKVTSKDYTYDFFNITQIHNGTLQLNGCGNLPDDVCGQGATACDGKKVISKKVPSLVVESDVLVTTTYEPVGAKDLKVRYNCDHMAEVANVAAVQKHGNQITVDVSTTVSCAPKAIDCNPSGADGRTYDLSGLRNINWEAESSDGMKYYFSICSPLDRSKPDVAQCPGGPISSCQETTDGHKVNLGYAASNPEVSSTGTIRFHYINGERCKHGNGTPRQTTVTLNCKDVETTPRMTGEDSNCNYEIWWDTPKACPLEKAVTTECGVIKDDIRYDLSSLHNTRTAADTEGNLFYLAVCTNVSVVDSGDSCKGAAVCVKRDSIFKNVGNSKGMQIEADDGHIKLTYNNAAGNTSVITFLCNKDGPDNEVSFLWTDPVTRTHYFQWKTSLVCSPLEKECTRRTDGAEYDFSSLIRHDTNYLAHKYSGELYYINICYRVLATGPARHCPVGAAVCMASGPAENRTYHSLGRLGADNPIKALGGAVYIQYLDGETCPSNHSKKLTSLIMMRCNQNRQVVGEVEAAGSSENCRQDFILETSAACPVAASTTTVKPSAKSCTTIAGLNMDTLKKQYKVESPHHTYYVNFCGATGGDFSSCDGQASFGVCQVSKDSSQEQVLAGKPTSSAVEVEGRIVFNFTDGKPCAHGPTGSKRNVVLTLHCDQFVGRDSTPQFYGEDSADCTYHMGWGRPELCSPEKVTCSVNHNGHIVDFSALSDEMHFGIPTGDLASKYEGKNYLVSVCKPLSPSPLNKCPGAAICETSSAGSQAIGYVHSSPRVIDGDKKNWGIELVYNTTKPCDSKYPGSTISSIIKFTCGGYKGAPDLIDTDGCTYTFLWQTSEACDEDANSQVPGKCEIKNSKTDDIIDLSPLKGETFQVDNYKMAVCGSLPSGARGSCNDDAAVCINGNTSAGEYSTMQLNKHGDNIVLQYSNGSSCRGSDGAGTITTMIEFVCDPKAGKGQPSLELKFDSCVNSFRWKTAYVCAADCTFDYMGQLYDFRHLSPHRQPYSLSSQGYKFEMDICRNIPASVAGTEATCISVEKDGKKYPIAYTSSLVPHYWGEGRLALTYVGTENEHICPSPGQQASTLVKLTCHNSLGKPSFVSLASNCTFIFEWKTYVVCRDNTRVKVDVVDGVFTDPASSFIFNINQHLNHMVEVSESEYTYAISINNPLHEHCGDGSTHVCQYKPSFSRSIGKNIDSYYYQDEELQLVLNSTSTCGRLTSSNVQTVINFLCNDKAPNDSSPAFIDETHSCRYLFEWETPALCRPAAATTGGKHGLPGGAIAGIVIAVLVCVVIAIVIVYKVKRRRRWDGTYEYSGLSTDDDTTMLVSANKGSTPRYYDDDDELII